MPGDGGETIFAKRLDAIFRICLRVGRHWTTDEAAAAIKDANPAVKVRALKALRETEARAAALRAAGGLSPDSLQAITAVLDQTRRLQGLPLVDDEPES